MITNGTCRNTKAKGRSGATEGKENLPHTKVLKNKIMNIDKVTLTGADDHTSLQDLKDLSRRYPFVEWGILFSKSREATLRYPSETKIKEIAASGVELSAHFCGQFARQVLEKQDFGLISSLPDAFQRVQLNYNFKNSIGWNVKPLIDYAERNPDRAIIFQANASNSHTIAFIHGSHYPANIHFLYDSSGGRGTEIQKIRPPFDSYTGYSGGLSPDNVGQVVSLIAQRPEKNTVWIDMESGVRTENYFDIEKCEEVLEACSYHINRKDNL